MSNLSHADAAWLHMETPTNLMMITGLIFLGSTPERGWLEDVLEHRLCRYERFRMRVREPKLGIGLPHWEKAPDFEVAHHLVYETLPDPSLEKLLQRVGELMSEPLDREQPLWEFRVFPGVEGRAAMVGRLHHCIGDGIALMRVLLSLCDKTAHAPRPTACPEPTHKEAHVGSLQKAKRLTSHILHEGHDLLFHPSHAAELAHQGVSAGKALARLLSLPPDNDNAFRGELQAKKLAALSEPFSLTEVKTLGKRLGCTINDVLMATLAGGLGRSLRRFQDVDQESLIRGIVPVDLRGGDVAQLGNRFGLVFLSLPVGESDPHRRLQRVHETMTELKNSAEAVVAFELLSAVGIMPAELEKLIISWFGNKATAVVTNLPGPRERMFLAGSEVESVMYWVPQSGRLGLGISLLSYANQIRLGVTTDAAILPNPEYIVEDFMTTLDEMLSLEAL
jgi:diacylglycerol O-acyltransferase / wax synthase